MTRFLLAQNLLSSLNKTDNKAVQLDTLLQCGVDLNNVFTDSGETILQRMISNQGEQPQEDQGR